jgi:hypothetical protein
MIRTALIFIWLSISLSLLSARLTARDPKNVAARPAPQAAVEEKTRQKISAEGETFVLRSSSRSDGVETEEYLVDGQDSENWTELITCQRLVLPEVLNADEYVTLLKQRLQNADPTAHVRVVQAHPRAAVFGIEYKAEDVRAAQLAFVLVTAVGAARSREIQLIQYTVRPGTMDFEQLQTRAERWQARFQTQALLAQAEQAALRPQP